MTSTIKVNNIQNQCGANIIKENSNTITLGASGDTIALASGASQTGFGRTGTVDWQTGSIKTSTFTAANGEGYFANTSGGAFVMNLPAGTAGSIVSVVDYTNTFQTNALTITPNGSQKLGGTNASVNLSTEGQSVTLVYVDDTEGWKNTMDSTSNIIGSAFISACVSGSCNTQVTCGNFKTAIFKGPGTFTVNSTASLASNNVVDYLVVAGGGGGALDYGSGGGAGGFRYFSALSPAGSPLVAPAGITVTATGFPIVVGGGGAIASAPAANNGTSGSVSSGLGISSAGGGGGAGASTNPAPSGGSGAGAKGMSSGVGGSGNTPPVSPPQGNSGGSGQGGGSSEGPGGGGGAGAVGGNGVSATSTGSGGAGSNIVDGLIGPTAPSYGEPGPVSSTRYFAGGGGGGGTSNIPGPGTGVGGVGGGGDGSSPSVTGPAPAGVANTGGGGGGTSANGDGGGAGGSGIVMIRYKFQ